MKKLLILSLITVIHLALFSCTPESIIDSTEDVQACCGNEGPIIVPPPPPPPPEDGNGD